MNILIVEDQMMLAFAMRDHLVRNGFGVVGPCPTVARALEALSAATVNAALLDIHLGEGVTSLPVAEVLTVRRIPFVFVTGYGSGKIPIGEFANVRRLSKPVRNDDLLRTVQQLTA